MYGIDVSHHNGAVNWAAVKTSGVEFAILRAGYGMYDSQKDTRFEANYNGAKAAGVPVGAYWYSYAKNTEEARQSNCRKKFDFPVYLDIEDNSQAALGKETITEI